MMQDVVRHELLAVTPAIFFLSDQDDETRASFAALGNCRTYPKNNILYHHGDPCTSAFVVVTGRVKLVLATDDGREFVLDTFGPGDICGLIATLDGGAHTGTAITLERARIAVLSADRLQAWLTAHPLLHQKIAVDLAQIIRHAYERVGMQALLNVKRRIHATLLEIARQDGTADAHEGALVAPRPTHQELAERIGSSRVVVSRFLKELLEEERSISMEGRTLRVTLHAVEADDTDPGPFY
jgi:CRP/FNR family transcriptional regulator, cyclic AMP receptor protein